MIYVKACTACFPLKALLVSGFTFKSLIYFEFTSVYGVRRWSNFIVLHVAVHFPNTTY